MVFPLSNNAITIIDDLDYNVVNRYSWSRTKNGYAINGNGVLMHRGKFYSGGYYTTIREAEIARNQLKEAVCLS